MFSRYEVKGRSMEPFFSEGDRVLLLRTKNIKKGDIAVFSTPERDCIKRVAAVKDDEFFVEGDNKAASTDSRHYGTVNKEQVVGKVLLKY